MKRLACRCNLIVYPSYALLLVYFVMVGMLFSENINMLMH